MAWQGGWVQLEQCNMCLAMFLFNRGKGVLLGGETQETKWLIENTLPNVREEKKWDSECPGHER